MARIRARFLGAASLVAAIAMGAAPGAAVEPRQDPVPDAGRTAPPAGRTAGEAARQTGQAIGEAARQTGRTIGEAARETGRAIRDAAQDAGRPATTTGVPTGTQLRGTVTRVDAAGNEFVVRTPQGREVTIYGDPQTTYRLGTQGARLDAIREGTNLDIVYDLRDNRYFAHSVALATMADRDGGTTVTTRERTSRYGEPDDAAPGMMKLHGRIAQVYINPTQFVLQTTDGREVTVFVDSRQDVSVAVENRDGKYYLKSFGIGANQAVTRTESERRNYVDSAVPTTTTTTTTKGTTLEGTIVRVQGTDNQFVLRTADGREVTFYSDPQAVIRYDNRVVPFTELQEGTPATVIYEPNGSRKVVRSIVGRRRR